MLVEELKKGSHDLRALMLCIRVVAQTYSNSFVKPVILKASLMLSLRSLM